MTDSRFWSVLGMVSLATLFHYGGRIRYLPWTPYDDSIFGARHAMERVLFVLPIAYAAFSFGWVGGLITALVAMLVMLPRALFISAQPLDAILETMAVMLVGGLVSWMVERQEREKRLREEAVSRLEATSAVSAIVSQSLELKQILSDALDKVLEVMGLEGGAVYILEEGGQGLSLAAHRGLPRELIEGAEGLKLARRMVRYEGFQGHLAGFLQSKGKVEGVLVVASREPRRFLPEEMDLITVIANQIGVAIENAVLHQDVARQLEVERSLNKVAEEITSELELARVLPKVLEIAEGLVGAEAGDIGLWDEERKVITYPYLHNVSPELKKVVVAKGEGIAGAVMTSGRPLVVEDYSSYPQAIDAFVKAGLKSVLSVPIVSGEKRFGALSVYSLSQAKRFSERDIALVVGVGRQAGIAIENARLYENMHSYVWQITRAQEEERKRIARELHDDTAQALIVLSRGLDTLITSPEPFPPSAIERLEELRRVGEEISRGVRRFSRDLRPSTLDDLGLLPTLEALTSTLAEEGGIEAELKVVGQRRRLSPETELVLFRITQEALNNVKKHSQASRVMTTVEFADGAVQVTVRDNGRGFELPSRTSDLATAGKLGLIGMQERAQLIGGSLNVQSAPGKGTTVTIMVPG